MCIRDSIYTFMKQKQKKQAEKEALDPDANYTEDKGDFEILSLIHI